MADKPQLNITAKLDKNSSKKAIQSQLDDISKNLKLTIGVDKSGAKEIANQDKELKSVNSNIKIYKQLVDEVSHAYKTQSLTAKEIIDETNELRILEEYNTASKQTQAKLYNTMISAEKAYTKTLTDEFKLNQSIEAQKLAEEKASQSKIEQIRKTEIMYAEMFDYIEAEEIKKSTREANASAKELAAVQKYTLAIEESKNSAIKNAEALNKYRMSGAQKTELDGYLKTLNEVNPAMAKNSTELLTMKNNADKASKGVRDLKTSVTASGKSALKFSEYLKNAATAFSLWMSVSTVFFAVVRSIKAGVEATIELDTAMTDLNKVTDLTSEQLDIVAISARDLGDDLSTTTAAVINATTAFARMGFEAEEALNLAKYAIILKNVGDGIDSVDESTSTLIATLKGFQMDASEVSHVVDSLNKISNEFAVTTEDLSSGIERAASVASASGASFEQTLGLLTAMTEVSQNAEKSSTALRTLALRIQGLSEDGEALDTEFVAKFNEDFEKIAGVSITVDGKLRNIYDIITDLGSVWGNLTQEEKLYLSTQAVGIRQSGEFINLLNNYKTAINATEAALNSEGSALLENEKYLSSIQGRVDDFTAALTNMWTNAINGDGIKLLVDMGTGLVNIVDTLGLLNTALMVTVGILAALKGEAIYASITKIGTALFGLNATLAISAPQLAIITAAIGGFIMIADKMIVSEKELESKIAESTSALVDHESRLQSLLTKREQGVDVSDIEIERLEKRIELEKELIRLDNVDLAKKSLFGEGVLGKGLSSDLEETSSLYKATITRLEYLDKQLKEGSISENEYTEATDRLSDAQEKLQSDLYSQLDIMESYVEFLDGDQKTTIEDAITKYKEWLGISDSTIDSTERETAERYQLTLALKQSDSVISHIQKSTDKLKETQDDAQDIVGKLVDGYKYQGFELIELLNKYPQLNKYLDEHNELTITKEELINELVGTQKTATIESLKNDAKELESKKELLKGTITYYEKYLEIAEAMIRLDAQAEGRDVSLITEANITDALSALKSAKTGLGKVNKQILTTNRDIGILEDNFGGVYSVKSDTNESTTNILDNFKAQQQAVSDLSYEIDILSSKINLAQGDDKIALQKQQIELYKQQQEAVHQYSEALRALIEKGGLSTDELEDINGQLQDNGKEWWSIKEAISSVNDAIETQIQDAVDAQNELIETQKELVSELRESISDMVKQEMQDEVDSLEDQIDSAKELLDIKLQQLEAEKELNDYTKDKAELEAQIADYTSQINSLQTAANQGDLKAQALIAELESEREDSQENLDELINDRAYELRKESLEAQYDEYESTKQDEIDLLESNMDDAEYIAKETNHRIQSYLSDSTSTLYQDLVDWNAKYGESFDDSILSKWEEVLSYVKQYSDLMGGDFSFSGYDSSATGAVVGSVEYWKQQTGADAATKSMINWLKTGNLTEDEIAGALNYLNKYGQIYDNGGELKKGDIALKEDSAQEFVLGNEGIQTIIGQSVSKLMSQLTSSSIPSTTSSSTSSDSVFNINISGVSESTVQPIVQSVKNLANQITEAQLNTFKTLGFKPTLRRL